MRYQQSAQGDWGQMRASVGITTKTEYHQTSDGGKLFLRSWQTGGNAVLLILHGLGGHSGWYIDLGNVLAADGINVYAVDHRGFGRSEGPRGHIDAHRKYVDDIASILTEIHKRHPDSRVFLLGHSMGGIFASHVAAQYPELLSGAIFLNPWIQDSTQLPLSTTLSIFTRGLLRSRSTWQSPGGPENMTTNPEALQLLQEDPYWQRQLTPTFLVQIFLMRLAVPRIAPKIQVPALVIQVDADRSVIPAATQNFYQRLASSDKTWLAYPDYAHDTQFEENRTQLDSDISQWIQTHARRDEHPASAPL